jgi:hypothetical protein
MDQERTISPARHAVLSEYVSNQDVETNGRTT